MKFPPKSPDLYSIETIWADLKKTVRNKTIINKIYLIKAINEYQRSLTPEKCGRYIPNLK